MAIESHDRIYDLVILGATGYTGVLTAEHIVEHLPTNLKWAISGRSSAKLEALAERLKRLNPDRLQPVIEIASLDEQEIAAVVHKARVCITLIGPYSRNGEAAVHACIDSGTHYIDAAGDIPFQREMIKKYDTQAKANGVILVSMCGTFGGPQDLLARAAVEELGKRVSLKTKELILAYVEIDLKPSGGSLESLMEKNNYSKALHLEKDPWILSPIRGDQITDNTDILGMRYDPDLGSLCANTTSAVQNRALVHRTWALLDQGGLYGSKFYYNEYSKTSTMGGIFSQMLLSFQLGLLRSPLQRFIKLFLPAPGQGPDPEQTKKTRIVLEAVAVADEHSLKPKRAQSRLVYLGGPYHLTGALLAQAAEMLLYDPGTMKYDNSGFITPAALGDAMRVRMETVGMEISSKML